jgi:hypothetical protein
MNFRRLSERVRVDPERAQRVYEYKLLLKRQIDRKFNDDGYPLTQAEHLDEVDPERYYEDKEDTCGLG